MDRQNQEPNETADYPVNGKTGQDSSAVLQCTQYLLPQSRQVTS